jgi:tripartite-type tricarboxylate transporter receptor subunit TctC
MKLPRRKFLHLAAGAAALPAISRIARAQAYPSRPVRIVVGLAAGGGADIVARLIAQWLSERLGQPFIIENRPGASNNIGTEAVVRAPADGYTFLFVTTANAVNASLYDKLNFVFLRDIAPVAGLTRSPYFWVVNRSFPVRTIAEFIAYARANPGKLSVGGAGATQQAAIELFKSMAGVDMLYVPYRGDAPGLTDVMGGQLQAYLAGTIGTIEHIKAGRLHGLAVTAATRSELLPGIPTVAEFVPGYQASAFFGVGAPKGTPAEIIAKLNNEINAALASPVMKGRLADLGATVFPSSPDEFGRFVSEETEKWDKVIRAANIKAE